MASLQIKSGTYYASLTFPDGTRTSRTTGIKAPANGDPEEAKAKESASKKAEQMQSKVDQGIPLEEPQSDPVEIPTLGKAINIFIERTTAPEQLKHLKYAFDERIIPFAKSAINQPIHTLDEFFWADFYPSLRKANYSVTTSRRTVQDVRALYTFAIHCGWAARNPITTPVNETKESSRTLKPYTIDQIKYVLASNKTLDWRTAILLGCHAGAELLDACRATFDRVDFSNHTIEFESLRRNGKIYCIRIPMTQELESHLLSLQRLGLGNCLTPSLHLLKEAVLNSDFRKLVTDCGLRLPTVESPIGIRYNLQPFRSLRLHFAKQIGFKDGLNHFNRFVHKLDPDELKRRIKSIPPLDLPPHPLLLQSASLNACQTSMHENSTSLQSKLEQ